MRALLGAARRFVGSALITVGARLLFPDLDRQVEEARDEMRRGQAASDPVRRVGNVGFTPEADAMIAHGRAPGIARPAEEGEEILAGSLRAQGRR